MSEDGRVGEPAGPPTVAGSLRPGPAGRLLRFVLTALLPVALIGGAVAGAVRLIETAPRAERRPPEARSTPVEVMILERATVPAVIQAMGTVTAAEEIVLQPRVAGQIVELSPEFVPGGCFKAGEVILRIDPSDYELAVQRVRGQLAQSEYELKLEQGYQEIARREWELLDMQAQASEQDMELALRRPQLARSTAMLEASRAALREAELNLERTTIRAPFNSMVRSENVDVGSQVTPQSPLGTLVGTDRYWVQAAVPVDELGWIVFPDSRGTPGSPALIRQELGTGLYGEWSGTVVRLLADLEPRGRMARVLIEVPDPLKLDAANGRRLPLLLDAYVNVTIEGREVRDVLTVPRTALREGRRLWIMNENDALEIRDVEVIRGNRETVLVGSGARAGERLVVSDLAAPVAGMPLRTRDRRSGSSRPADGGAAGGSAWRPATQEARRGD